MQLPDVSDSTSATAAQLAAEAEMAAVAQAKALAAAQALAAKAAKAQAEAERAAREADKLAGKVSKANKYGTVEKVNKQAERIAERKARGEEAPKLFDFN